MTEKDPLLTNDSIQQAVSATYDGDGKKITWRHLALAPVIFLVALDSGLFMFVCDEWTQSVIQTEYNPVNTSFPLCDVVNKSDPDYVTYQDVQQKASHWFMYYRLAGLIPTLVASLLLPSYSDFYGRRKFIILGIVGQAILICGGTIVIFAKLDLFYITILSAIQGATDVMFSVSFPYVADITLGEKQRVKGIIVLDFLILAGYLVASPLSGGLIQTLELGFAYTGAICSCLIILALLIGCLFVPESLEKDRRPKTQSVSLTLKNVFSFYSTTEFKSNRLSFGLLFVSFLLTSICDSSRELMEILYLLGQPFCWGPELIGYFTLARNAAIGIIGLIAINVLQKYMSNISIALLSCLSIAGSFVVEGLARTTVVIYCAPVVGMLSYLIFPMIRGLMSTMTSSETQGSLFATLSFVQGVGGILSVAENEIYAASMSIMNGFVFLCMAGIAMVEIGLLIVFRLIQTRDNAGSETLKPS